jgi:hypothetical protein
MAQNTPHAALKKLRKKHTLEDIQKMLAKKKISTSISTLWRILDDASYEPKTKLADAIRTLEPKKATA